MITRALTLRGLLVALVTVPLLALSSTDSHAEITVTQIKGLTSMGIPASEIIKVIDREKAVFHLTVQDILGLKKAGVDKKVLSYMLSTPQRFGKKGAKTTKKTTEPSQPAAPELTDEERRAEEERMRLDALKMLEEKKKVEQARRKAYAKGVLAKGRALAQEGKFVESIQAYQSFVQLNGFGPDTEEAYLANFGIAEALVKAGLYQSAAKQLVDILLAGPERPFFQSAFEQLRELRKIVNYSPPDLEELTKFFVGKFSQTFQDSYNYVIGEFYYDYNNWTQVLKYLDVVSPRSKDYGKAQYLKGLVEVRNQLYKSAVGSFQKAVVATEENNSDAEVKDLSFLALARIAYEAGDYDAAIYYYRKIPNRSYKRATALYESAWVYFVKGDFSRALGTFHSLHSPYFKHQFYPELWILESTIYMNLCHFGHAENALKEFRREVLPLATPLKSFLVKTVRPEEFYVALVSTLKGQKNYGLPSRLIALVMSNVDFYNLYKTVKQIEYEQSTIKGNAERLGGFGAELSTKLSDLHAGRVRDIGYKIQQILKTSEGNLADYEQKSREIQEDLFNEQLKEEERKLREIAGDGAEQTADTTATGGATAIVGSDSWEWPFEGDYWSDEIGYYRAFIRDQCPDDQNTVE
jgi:tetratricopeptide (TPR) repeat protein